MSSRLINIERSTRETSIALSLDFDAPLQSVDTGLPFFDHILTSMAYHGFFGLTIKAAGDVQVDAHHLVEDVGIALGSALQQTVQQYGHVERYGQSLIPMDEALSESGDRCKRTPLFGVQRRLSAGVLWTIPHPTDP
ncbi:MAG: hypothetical protein U5P10_01800 [Spirochaetia bacterium]|nr:hypothetical protein [Spirochaetia bacterium]